MKSVRLLQAKRLTHKGILRYSPASRVKAWNFLPSGKPSGMVREVDDGPKTDRLLVRPLRSSLGLSGSAGASWEY